MNALFQNIEQRQRQIATAMKSASGFAVPSLARNHAYVLSKSGDGVLGYNDSNAVLQGEPDTKRMRAVFVISTQDQDRDGDVVLAQSPIPYLDNYQRAGGPVFFGHQSFPIPIGSCTAPDGTFEFWCKEDRIESAVWFAQNGIDPSIQPTGAQMFGLVQEKLMRSASIGFAPIQTERLKGSKGSSFREQGAREQNDMPGFLFRVIDVLEWSLVGTPSQPGSELISVGLSKGIMFGDPISPMLRKALTPFAVPMTGAVQSGYFSGRGGTLADAIDRRKSTALKSTPLVIQKGTAYGQQANSLRWNKRLDEAFDVAEQEIEPCSMLIDWASRYLQVPVKKIYQTSEIIPGVRMGDFLTGLREVLAMEFQPEDTRNLRGSSEAPPFYDTIKLNSKKSDTFLLEGTVFYKGQQHGLVIDTSPSWSGVELTYYVPFEFQDELKDIVRKVHDWMHKNNSLRGEKFSLSGEFLDTTKEDWSDLFLEETNFKPVKSVVERMNKKGKDFPNHGSILSGPPGTGKTLACRIIMNQADATFIWVSARDFHYAGSFGGMTMAFDLAKELAPSVIVFEDVDNWMGESSIDFVKTEMDGVARYKGVWTILTTNFPERIPEALIDRPGRFHDVLQFAVPTAEARKQMIRKWVPGISDSKLTTAVVNTDTYSGAHIYHLSAFAKSLQESEGIGVDESVELAIEKVREQRELINGIQLEGSRYRPRKDVAALITKSKNHVGSGGKLPVTTVEKTPSPLPVSAVGRSDDDFTPRETRMLRQFQRSFGKLAAVLMPTVKKKVGRKSSYFADCDRDEGGHCKPNGAGDASAADTNTDTNTDTSTEYDIQTPDEISTNLGKIAGAADHLHHYLHDKAALGFGKLPTPVQGAVKAVLSVAFAGWTASQKIAERISIEKGSTPEQAAATRSTLAAWDIVAFKPVAIATAPLGGTVAAATWIVPPITGMYLCHAAVRHPIATFRAAKGIVKDIVAGARSAVDSHTVHLSITGYFQKDGEPLDDAPTPDQKAIIDALERQRYDDWYTAILHAALEETKDVTLAIEAADQAFAANPADTSTPQEDDADALFAPDDDAEEKQLLLHIGKQISLLKGVFSEDEHPRGQPGNAGQFGPGGGGGGEDKPAGDAKPEDKPAENHAQQPAPPKADAPHFRGDAENPATFLVLPGRGKNGGPLEVWNRDTKYAQEIVRVGETSALNSVLPVQQQFTSQAEDIMDGADADESVQAGLDASAAWAEDFDKRLEARHGYAVESIKEIWGKDADPENLTTIDAARQECRETVMTALQEMDAALENIRDNYSWEIEDENDETKITDNEAARLEADAELGSAQATLDDAIKEAFDRYGNIVEDAVDDIGARVEEREEAEEAEHSEQASAVADSLNGYEDAADALEDAISENEGLAEVGNRYRVWYDESDGTWGYSDAEDLDDYPGKPADSNKKHIRPPIFKMLRTSIWKDQGHKPPGPGGGQFTSGQGSGGDLHHEESDQDSPSESDASFAKLPAIRGEMGAARREGKGKDAKVVMADGSPAPEWIKPGMIAPTLTNVKVATDPKAEVLVIGTKPNGETFTGYSDSFHARNAALKFDRVQEMLQKHEKIFNQNQENRKDPAKKENADCVWLMDVQATRPGGDVDTKGLAEHYGKPMTPDMIVEDEKGKIGIRVAEDKIIPIKDKGTAEQIKRIRDENGDLHDTTFWLKSHGATTLEARNVVESSDGIRLQFVGKEGVWHDHLINDRPLADMLLERKNSTEERGGKLFDTDYAAVTKYTKTLDGGKFTPKDMRTKRANLLALRETATPKEFTDDKSYKKAVMEVAERVSSVLGNKAQQALESYINPMVFAKWRASFA